MVDDAPESTIRVMPHDCMHTLELELATCIPCAGTSHVMLDEHLIVLDDGEELAMAHDWPFFV